jgi:hypothetical protein
MEQAYHPQGAGNVTNMPGILPQVGSAMPHKNAIYLLIFPNIPEIHGTIPALEARQGDGRAHRRHRLQGALGRH